MLLSSFRYTSGLHCITPPFVSLQSSISTNLSNPRKRSSFIPFRSPFTRSITPQLWLPSLNHSHKPKYWGFIPPCAVLFIPFSHYPCFSSPIQRYALPLTHPIKKESILVSTPSNGYFFNLIFRPKKFNLTSLETNILIVIAIEILVIM